MEFLKKHWRGEGKLWSAFWIVGGLGKGLTCTLIAFLIYFLAANIQNPIIVKALIVWGYAILFLYLAFALICIWRCSKNVSHGVFTAIAKVYVIFIPILVTYVIFRH